MKQPDKLQIIREAIALLKTKKEYELSMLKQQAHITYESLQPINFVKSTIHKFTSAPEIKNNLLKIALGLGTSFLAARFTTFLSSTPINRFVGGFMKTIVGKVKSEK